MGNPDLSYVQSQQSQLCCVYISIYVSCNKDLKQNDDGDDDGDDDDDDDDDERSQLRTLPMTVATFGGC